MSDLGWIKKEDEDEIYYVMLYKGKIIYPICIKKTDGFLSNSILKAEIKHPMDWETGIFFTEIIHENDLDVLKLKALLKAKEIGYEITEIY